jgi:MoaA/NifB/PqqE/SkfB family radical SAM enzyme
MKTAELVGSERSGETLAHYPPRGRVTECAIVPDEKPALSNGTLGGLLDKNISAAFIDAVKIALRKPAWFTTAVSLYFRQRAAAKKRRAWRLQGTHIPPFIIMSVTKSCNLRCKGCYSHSLHASNSPSLTDQRITELLAEARHLGISLVLLAGGEPLINKKLLNITGGFPEITFPLFTNGTLIDDSVIAALKRQRNVIPVLSIEGTRAETDSRRGGGVFDRVDAAMSLLRKHGLFFGCSITVTSENFPMVYDPAWLGQLYRNGCRLFFHVEYVPVDKGTEALVVTDAQRTSAIGAIAGIKKTVPALYVAFPGDEELFGGCLAAGRGFIHINASGDLEPCPFAPYSDRNVTDTSLKSALRSPLLEKIRANHANLQETSGGCALWAEREWVASLTSPRPSA